MPTYDSDAKRIFGQLDAADQPEPMTWKRVKDAIRRAFFAAPAGSDIERYHYDGLCEAVLIERRLKNEEEKRERYVPARESTYHQRFPSDPDTTARLKRVIESK